AWTAQLTGGDDSEVGSVVFWVRDARNQWRSSPAVDTVPFRAPVEWWLGDNSGYEVITAHVTLRTGQVVSDPGGWRWVDGRGIDPQGLSTVRLNADGSASASYRPARNATVISRVEFWL